MGREPQTLCIRPKCFIHSAILAADNLTALSINYILTLGRNLLEVVSRNLESASQTRLSLQENRSRLNLLTLAELELSIFSDS